MTNPIMPRATKPPTIPPAIAPASDDLCVTPSEDEKDDVDEDEGVSVVDTVGDAVVVIIIVVVVINVRPGTSVKPCASASNSTAVTLRVFPEVTS